MPIALSLSLMMALLEMIDLTSLKDSFERKRKNLAELRKEPVRARKQRLMALRDWIHKNRPSIHTAMFEDFSKPSSEVDAIEIFHVLNEIQQAVNNLDQWTAPKKIDAPLTMLGTRSYIKHEARGLCLIISPWNYPFSLAVGPMISALAAGNAVILKPSELTPHVSNLLHQMCLKIFNENIVSVIQGDAEISKELLKFPFDHIFFTGSPAIGKVVMKAAAENLTSVTLELGGKSPTIVTASANLQDAAQRIAVAKFVNNGQTCVAPDYILIDEKIADRFIILLSNQVKKLFSEKGDFKNSKSYCRIVNDRHFSRLNDLLQDGLNQGAHIELGGSVDQNSRFFHPIILTQVPPQCRMMNEEIFGPILPIITFKEINEAIAIINSKPKPLALYLYTSSKSTKEKVLTETSAGAVCINDSGIHFLHSNLPFGGVNNSGIGKSHGHYGFLAFSNEKPVLQQKSGFTLIKLFYPPYTTGSKRIMDWFLKFF